MGTKANAGATATPATTASDRHRLWNSILYSIWRSLVRRGDGVVPVVCPSRVKSAIAREKSVTRSKKILTHHSTHVDVIAEADAALYMNVPPLPSCSYVYLG